MNFDRTYAGYNWSAWNAAGGLNDCRVGGNATFDSGAPAVRLRSVNPLLNGKLQAAGVGVRVSVAKTQTDPETVTENGITTCPRWIPHLRHTTAGWTPRRRAIATITGSSMSTVSSGVRSRSGRPGEPIGE